MANTTYFSYIKVAGQDDIRYTVQDVLSYTSIPNLLNRITVLENTVSYLTSRIEAIENAQYEQIDPTPNKSSDING